jgi:SSS family solute:Na+ symporter
MRNATALRSGTGGGYDDRLHLVRLMISLPLIIVLVYFSFLLAVGVVFGRMVKDGDDFFRAGAQGTWWLVGTSMFMAGISAYTFTGNAAGIYRSGWSPLAIYAANVAGLLICGLFLASWYRQMRVVTIAEALRLRFGKVTEQVFAILIVVNTIIWSGVVLYGLSIFGQFLFPDISPQLIIVGVGVVVLIYCTVGGSWAVMANDFVQGLIMISMTLLLAILCVVHAGGWEGFGQALAAKPDVARDFQLVTPLAEGESFWGAQYGLTWIFIAFITQFVNQMGLFNGVRYFSAKDGREACRASLLAAGLMLVGSLLWFVPPMYARLFLEPVVMAMHADPAKAPEYSYATASLHLLPQGLFSIMIVAMFAAAISSMDTGLNRNSALIVRNILPALLGVVKLPALPERHQVVAGRIATLGCGAVIILLALGYASLSGVSLFDFMLQIVAFFFMPQMVPMLLFLFLRKTAPWAAVSSILAGFVPSLANFFLEFGWSYQVQAVWVITSAMAGYLVAIPFWSRSPAEYRERVARFYDCMRRPVDFTREVGAGSDALQMRLIGRFGCVLAVAFLLLLFLPNPPEGRWSIMGISLFVFGISALLIWRATREARRHAAPVLPSSPPEPAES